MARRTSRSHRRTSRKPQTSRLLGKLNKEIRDLRACVYAADALAQEMNNLNEGADESVADYELAAYCEARALVTR